MPPPLLVYLPQYMNTSCPWLYSLYYIQWLSASGTTGVSRMDMSCLGTHGYGTHLV